MTTTTKQLGFFFQTKGTTDQEMVREVFNTFASNNFLITTENLEELLGRTIPDHLLRFNEEDFVFCQYSINTWEVKKLTLPQI